MKPKISQFQVPSDTNISVMTRPPCRSTAASPAAAACPAVGTEPRRAAAAADAALSPKVALAISPMPASEPSMLIASTGSMMIFWFGESASWPNALMYLSAMK